ncbi:MAG TPA: MFS transporter [Caldilineaceae bacterium]|nr:MFS transporter [Caldilineaceae bacterium]
MTSAEDSVSKGLAETAALVEPMELASAVDMEATGKWTTGQLLRNRNFLLLWLGQVISAFGDAVTNLTLLILVNTLTGSTAAIATLTILIAIPQVTVGLLGGVFADRWDRKRIILASDLVRGVLVLGFLLVDSAQRLWLLYALAFVQAAVGTIDNPARGAILPQVVPKPGLLAANSLAQTGNLLAMVLGGVAAGVLVGFAGYWPAFVIDALTFFLSFALVSFVALAARASSESTAGQSLWALSRSVIRDLGAGLALIAKVPVLWGSLIVTGVMMLGLGSVNVLFVPFLANDLQVPLAWFGVVEFAQVFGMILSGGIAATVLKLKLGHVISGAAIGLGLAVAATAFAAAPWHVMVTLFVVGCFVTPLQAAIATLLQTSVDNALLGRVQSAMNTTIGAANLLSMACAGLLGALLGVRNVFIFAGVVSVLAGLLAVRLFRTTTVENKS